MFHLGRCKQQSLRQKLLPIQYFAFRYLSDIKNNLSIHHMKTRVFYSIGYAWQKLPFMVCRIFLAYEHHASS